MRAAVAFVFVVLAGGFEVAEPLASSGESVLYTEDSLTIHANSISGRDLLTEIGREVGFAIRAEGANLERAVTVSIEHVPVIAGIRMVLRQIGATNHALVYDPVTHQPVALVVFGEESGVPERSAPLTPVAAAVEPVARPVAAPVTEGVNPRATLDGLSREERDRQRRQRFEERKAARRERMQGEGFLGRVAEMRARAAQTDPSSLIAGE